MPDGGLATAAVSVPKDLNPFSVTVAFFPPSASYAGTAPGLINGVFQLNVPLPPGTGSGYTGTAPLSLSSNQLSSNTVHLVEVVSWDPV